MLNKILLFTIVLLISGCDGFSLESKIESAKKENKEPRDYNITFNDRFTGVYYKPSSWSGLTVITDNKTGREYMYYGNTTVVELKPKGE